jgi:predicted nuclease with TOPRIM domain
MNPLRQRLEERLQELRSEFAAGKSRLAELEQQHASLEQTLLRISGAVQVLEEELEEELERAVAEADSPGTSVRPSLVDAAGGGNTAA